jgi:AraC-like DNA-binding protein
MAKQGCALQQIEIQRIVRLLAGTEMTIREIAERTGCSRGAIVSINRRYQVREYAGHRSTWAVSAAFRQRGD